MADTTYTDGQAPLIYAAWLNDINNVAYRVLGTAGAVPTTVAQLLANLGLSNAVSSNGNINFTGNNIFAGTSEFTGAVTITGTTNLPASVEVGTGVLSALGYQYADVATQPQAFSVQTPALSSGAMTLVNNPCNLSFRSATLTTGGIATKALSAGVGITIPSGATLGAANGQTIRIAHGFAYNGGTPVPIIGNINGLNTDTSTLISPTMISSSSNAAGTWYSASAVSANSPFVIIGFYDSTQATAGTYATAPNVVPGDVAHIGAMQSLGVGQSWQDLTASRALGTTYYNTTGRSICVSVDTSNTSAGASASLYVNSVDINKQQVASAGYGLTLVGVVPSGSYYSVSWSGGSPSLVYWKELR